MQENLAKFVAESGCIIKMLMQNKPGGGSEWLWLL